MSGFNLKLAFKSSLSDNILPIKLNCTFKDQSRDRCDRRDHLSVYVLSARA